MTAPPVPSTEALARDPNLCPVCGHWCGLKCERPMEWNSRYLAYCAIAHGDSVPEVVLARDAAAHPGGRMTAFVVWLRGMVNEWTGESRRFGEPLDHAAFDWWLASRVFDVRMERGFVETGRGMR
jgi:hypothetical protein